jgi:hypothetical protein
MFLLYVFFLDINRWEKFRYCSLLLALILWGFALFLSIKNAGAFDERCFHRTRPYGDRRAFWQHTRLVGLTLLLVFIAMLIRGLYYHLGWKATLVGAATLTLLLLALGAGLSTGFSLGLSGVHRRKLVLALLLYLPVFCWILIKGRAVPRRMTLLYYMTHPWDYGITNGLLFAVVFSGCAWFCASFIRRWKTSLMLTFVAIFLLPCHLWFELVFGAGDWFVKPQTNSLNLRLRKDIDDADKKFQCIPSQFLRSDKPLAAAEFLTLRMQFSQNELLEHGMIDQIRNTRYLEEFPCAEFSITAAYAESPIIRTPNSMRTRPKALVLENLFPAATFMGGGNFSQIQYSTFDPKFIDAFRSLLSESEWKCTGSRNLMKRVATFRLDTGGKFQIDEGGIMIITPDNGKDGNLTARVQSIRPFKMDILHQKYIYYITWQIKDFHFVLTNSDETKAVSMNTHRYNGEMQFGAESSVANPVVQVHQLKDWTAEDIRDAKIHVLQTKMLERIEFDQSHLILEE